MGTEFLSFETWIKLCLLAAGGVWGYYLLMNAVSTHDLHRIESCDEQFGAEGLR